MAFSSRRVAAAVALTVAVTLSATACGGGSTSKLTILTPFDEPGMSIRNSDGTMSGFDVDVAAYVAQELGYKPDDIEWLEGPPGQHERLIRSDHVLVFGTYSITDARAQGVDFAGPYLIAGQRLLVRADNTDITSVNSLQNNKTLCSVVGSTPAQRLKAEYPGVQLQQDHYRYSACVEELKNGAVDAVTADDVLLAGYVAQSPGAFKLVGRPFSERSYGIGLKQGDTELRNKINDAIEKMESSGAWEKAFDKNLGPEGFTTPPPPQIDRYERNTHDGVGR